MYKALFTTILAFAIAANASANTDPQTAEKQQARHDKMVERVITKLKLDDSRASEVRTILDDGFTAKQAIREEKAPQVQAVLDERNAALQPLLTDEQMQTLNTLDKKMRKHHKKNKCEQSAERQLARQQKMVDKMMAKLAIEETQLADVEQIITASLTQLNTIKESTHEQSKALRTSVEEKLAAVLTEEEMKTVKKIQKRFHNRKGCNKGKKGKNKPQATPAAE